MARHAAALALRGRIPFGGSFTARSESVAIYSLIAAWMCFGLFGHDPWKPDEAYTFGLVYHILNSGDWVVPTLAGEPFMEKPPIFFITSALFSGLLGSWLPLHEAARFATLFYVGLTLLFVGATARKLYGDGRAMPAVLILIGCIGYLQPAHLLITDNSLAAGIAMALYGLALAVERPCWGGFLIGSGAGIAFLSKGLIGPGVIGLTALGLRFLPAWKNAAYARALVIAALAFAPWALLWPWLVYRQSPALFDEWFWANNFGRFTGSAKLGPTQDRLMYLKILPWFALPALPLAAWSAWQAPRQPAVQLPLLAAGVVFVVLSGAGSHRHLYAVPMLIALSVLAVAHADSAPRWLAWGLERFIVLLAGVLASAMWIAWAALLAGWPPAIVELLQADRPGFVVEIKPVLVAVAILATAGWLVVIRRENGLILTWAASVAIVWGLAMTLWLPYLDYGQSYRGLVADLKSHLPTGAGCIANRGLGEPQRAMLEYFGGIITYPRETTGHNCRVLLVQAWLKDGEPKVGRRWRLVWNGSRPGDDKERYWLYQRVPRQRELTSARARSRRAGPGCRPGSSSGSPDRAPILAAGSAAGHRRSETVARSRSKAFHAQSRSSDAAAQALAPVSGIW